MIVAERKRIPELVEMLSGNKRVLVLGCGTCVAVCLAGGEREVSIIASALRIASKVQDLGLEVDELTIERQCDNVFIEEAAETIEKHDVILSLGCGAGVQAIAERYAQKPVYPGLNTAFIGILDAIPDRLEAWPVHDLSAVARERHKPTQRHMPRRGEDVRTERRVLLLQRFEFPGGPACDVLGNDRGPAQLTVGPADREDALQHAKTGSPGTHVQPSCPLRSQARIPHRLDHQAEICLECIHLGAIDLVESAHRASVLRQIDAKVG